MSTVADLVAALGSLSDAFVVGFAQSPRADLFVRRVGDQLTSHGAEIAPDWIYDLRLWNAEAEFHWWWDQAGRCGRWVIFDGAAYQELEAGPQTRLLRGRVQKVDGDWVQLWDGHSQPLWVPTQAGIGKRVGLGAVEYVTTDRHGNVSVVAERLTEFREL
jgi:CRISPR-associated protein (TIGR03984 family)